MQRQYVVLKFGGTSVSSAKTWSAIARRASVLLGGKGGGSDVWIIVSAVSQVTNNLLRCLEECIDESLSDASACAACQLQP